MIGACVIVGAGVVAAAGSAADAPAAAAAIGTTGLVILAIAHVVIRARPWIRAIGPQVAIGVGVATLAGGAGVWLAIMLMPGGDAEWLLPAVTLAAAAALVTWTAYVIGMAVGDDVDRVSSGLASVGQGDRSVRLRVDGGDQVARLADSGNRMIDHLLIRETQREEAEATRHELVRAMVDQLRERAVERDVVEQQRKELFVGVSHDLRTPLTSLELLVSAIRDDMASPDERAAYAEQMLVQIAGLTQLTEQVFELSRLEAGDVGGVRVPMRIEELVRETAEQTRAAAEARGIDLLTEVADPLPPVEVAPERIARVLLNIVHNALAHTPPGGRVRIAARGAEAAVEVEVSDTGAGISPEDRAHIFEPFFRGGAGASRTGAGTGLGLAISRAIVEAHGGRIWLAEAPRGTTVRFTLPQRAPAG